MTKLRVLVVLFALVLAACAPATAPACVDVNADSRERLMLIVHVDAVRSTQMLSLRPFTSPEDLTRITGIGPDRLADIRAQNLVCPFDDE